jgi:hypothetical protein
MRALRAGLLFSLLYGAGAATAANLTSSILGDGKVIVTLDGEITAGDTDRFDALVKAANGQNRMVSGVHLNSPGGDVAEGPKLAAAIRFANIATVVSNDKQCASACFLVFAGGNEKFVSFSAQVGVHGAAGPDGSETASSGAATVGMARLSKELGVPEIIVGKMVVTPPSQIVWLTPNELRAMGATMTGKPSQTPPEASSQNAPMQLVPQTAVAAPAVPKWDDVTSNSLAGC